ncbi:MAG TPA: alpha-amylase family glycosyl hydrolase [Verrucomicrobiae bacterium]|nr:alpha-amylase family glycosyl hydrolase [Verrucomicrobiae bacterium]
MKITVHHQPVTAGLSWKMHVWELAWDGNSIWDMPGTPDGTTLDFQLPDVPDPRTLEFQYNSTDSTGQTTWEPSTFIRQVFQLAPTEIWTFESSARILYTNPFPAGVTFNPGDVLTVSVITQKQFRGGNIYAWNPYDATNPFIYFPESARNDATNVSTFTITLAAWMTGGFHFKLMLPGAGNAQAVWEPDAANRVWRPGDGSALWVKSGECDVRNTLLTLTLFPVEVLYPAAMATAPALVVMDVVEQMDIPLMATSVAPYAGNPVFNIATYSASIYPGASYTLSTQNNVENPSIARPFPADPANATWISRFALGTSAWVVNFPATTPATLSIQPHGTTSFGSGVSAQVFLGNSVSPYQTVPAVQQADGSWLANLTVVPTTTSSVFLVPVTGTEATPYAWINTTRYFTPATGIAAYFTTEGVYGICSKAKTTFAEPPSRTGLMQAMYGNVIVNANIFATREMPHGATLMGGNVYFVVHAPHAVCASLILVNETAPGGPARVEIPMTLTDDTFYWWCAVPAAQAAPGARYHFLLNDNLEVMDPAARAVQDRSQSIGVSFGDDPGNANTSWSMVADVAGAYTAAHQAPWQTMGWQNLLIYEIHANRFSDDNAKGLMPLDLLANELSAACNRGGPGYLLQLPVTTFGLMPVSEFSSTLSWGYDPSYYFAIDGFYGGAASLANFVNTAHQNGRAVTLDVVYNHSLGSSLMQIAPDVYRNGDYDGDRMNCGHPMMGEFFRQATIYLWRTFGLDGFRFDDTKTIITACTGGWQFLGMIRSTLRMAATAEGRAWPYCVAENSDNPWAVSNPSSGVMDGQWEIDESYRIQDASYDSWHPGWDDATPLANEMNQPAYWGRPFFQATRFGESHDMVSGQNAAIKRIAARPPLGQGFQLAKAMGALTLLSNGIPMLFMGQEVGETLNFSFDDAAAPVNPQKNDLPAATATDQTRILGWFRQLMGLRNDPTKGLQGDANYQVTGIGSRTVAFTCGAQQQFFVVTTFGTPNQQQNSSWLGLPGEGAFKEIFNSSWPDFQVESEPQYTNGSYAAQIYSGQILNLPYMGAVVLERS